MGHGQSGEELDNAAAQHRSAMRLHCRISPQRGFCLHTNKLPLCKNREFRDERRYDEKNRGDYVTDNLKKEGSGRESATGSRKRGSAGQVRNSHCSFCGERFAPDSLWPRECAGCGNKSYQNPLPVVVVLVPAGEGIVGVRRNIEPREGTVTLPGGFLDLGESWQEGGRREVLEDPSLRLAGPLLNLNLNLNLPFPYLPLTGSSTVN